MAEHKHAKILRAVADNEDVNIQYRDSTSQWHSCSLRDILVDDYDHVRIKPTIVKKWKWVYCIMDAGHEYDSISGLLSEAEFMGVYNSNNVLWYQKIDATMIEVEES